MFRQILSFFTSKATMEAGMAAEFFIGESLVGEGNEVAHIDLIIGSKGGPAGAATAASGVHHLASEEWQQPDVTASFGQ